MKKITTLLFALACVAIAANATVTVNVRTSTGDAPHLYVWNGAGTAINGAWPGTLMDASQTYTTTSDGLVWFTQTFEEDAINIIFNDGGIDGEEPFVQTSDIMGVTDAGFYIFDIEEGGYEDVTSTYITPTGFEGKEFAYFIAPTSWTNCNVWAWSGTSNFTTSGTWPGDPITLIGNTTDGNPVYQWIGADIVEGDRPTGIIFNNGSTQTKDLEYVAGGVYNLAGNLLYTVPAGGSNPPVAGDVNGDGNVTAADITALYDVLLNNDYTSAVNFDQNGDGNVTAADVTAVYDVMLGSK